jgi:hypothetical protein
MPAPELTLRTSGITWRTEGYGGPDNDLRLTALGELCVDVQRLARSTLVKDPPETPTHRILPHRRARSIPAIALSDTLNGAALDLDAGSWT